MKTGDIIILRAVTETNPAGYDPSREVVTTNGAMRPLACRRSSDHKWRNAPSGGRRSHGCPGGNLAQPGSRDVRSRIATVHIKSARQDSNLRPPV